MSIAVIRFPRASAPNIGSGYWFAAISESVQLAGEAPSGDVTAG